MNTFTIDDIHRLEPCYDPVTGYDQGGRLVHPGGFLPEDWQGTALDILRIDACPAIDRLWLVLRDGWIDDRTLRLFAVWCVRQALALVTTPDPRSVNVCDVAERFANGQATREELRAAGIAAVDAAWEAARVAAVDAAMEAAVDAAGIAAMEAARVAAWDAARVAAREAAGIAARVAAVDAARAAAREAAEEAAGAAAVDAAEEAAGIAAMEAAEEAAWAAACETAWAEACKAAGYAAGYVAWDAAVEAAGRKQVAQLIAMLEHEDISAGHDG